MEASPHPTAGALPAPVVLFAYSRPAHLRRTVESLLANPEAAATRLTVYCDAPRRPADRAATDAVRAYVASISGFASVERIYRDDNLGLARSVIDGVSAALRDHDRVIVLEDDLVVSPHFLRYMNDGLALYRDDARIASIHGYWYPTGAAVPETFFLRGADCWGWATWARAWRHFEPDGRRLLDEVRRRRLGREIDYDGTFPHLRILKRQIAGRVDSWAIRWHVSAYLDDMLTLYPGRSLVDNIGHDDSGTHCAASDVYVGTVATTPIAVERQPVQPSDAARAALVDFYRRNREPLPRKIWQRLKGRARAAWRERSALASR